MLPARYLTLLVIRKQKSNKIYALNVVKLAQVMLKMYRGTTLILLCLSMTLSYSELFSADKIRRYAKFLKFNALNINETGNDLWHGLFRDCSKRVTFSCIQKNAYTYLDNTFIERDNITIFDGLILTKNNITYDACSKTENRNDVHENLVDVDTNDCENKEAEDRKAQERKFGDESPLEEITNALRRKTVKFLSTRNYEIQLPQFFFEGATMKISPREIDENGALLRIDFGTDGVQEQGRIFKKISKKNPITQYLLQNVKDGECNVLFYFREVYTEQVANKFSGASLDHQAD